jgi:GNAT superfamily N-acetyltransferase
MCWTFAKKKDMAALRDFLVTREWECAALTGRLRSAAGRPELPPPASALVALRKNGAAIRQVLYMRPNGFIIPYFPGLCLSDPGEAEAVREVFFRAWGALGVLVGLRAFTRAFALWIGVRPAACVDYYLMRARELPPGLSLPEIPRFEIRRARQEDLESILPLQEAYEKEEILLNQEDFDSGKTRKELAHNLKNQIIYLVFLDGKLIAKGGTNSRGFTCDQIGGVFTRPDFRGKKAARFLMNSLLAHIYADGKQACLFVKKHNLPAISLYGSLGFRIAENYRISYF